MGGRCIVWLSEGPVEKYDSKAYVIRLTSGCLIMIVMTVTFTAFVQLSTLLMIAKSLYQSCMAFHLALVTPCSFRSAENHFQDRKLAWKCRPIYRNYACYWRMSSVVLGIVLCINRVYSPVKRTSVGPRKLCILPTHGVQ